MTSHELQIWLEDRLNRLQDTQVDIREDLTKIQVTIAEQAKDVAHHIKRTDELEARVEQVAADIKPVREHVQQLKGVVKAVGLLAVSLGIVVSWLKIFG